VAAAEKRHAREIQDNAARGVVALRHFRAKLLEGEVAEFFDRFAGIALENLRFLVKRESPGENPEDLPDA